MLNQNFVARLSVNHLCPNRLDATPPKPWTCFRWRFDWSRAFNHPQYGANMSSTSLLPHLPCRHGLRPWLQQHCARLIWKQVEIFKP